MLAKTAPVYKANACYDQSQQLYDLVSKVVADVLATNPGVGPPPAPGVFPPPVLDGSPAVPGTVGEVLATSFNVNIPNVLNTGIVVGNLFLSSLPIGDWELSYMVRILGGQVLSAWCQLDTTLAVASIPGNMLSYCIATSQAFNGVATMAALPLWCPPVPYASGRSQLLAFRMGFFSGTGTTIPSTPVQFNGWARRMR